MLYLLDLMAKRHHPAGISVSNQGTQHSLCDGQWNSGSFFRVSYEHKLGTSKMDRRDQKLLDTQMRRLSPPRNDGVIVVLLVAMFLVGMTLGGVLSEPKTEPIQIASMD
jgi:hypothetical protein